LSTFLTFHISREWFCYCVPSKLQYYLFYCLKSKQCRSSLLLMHCFICKHLFAPCLYVTTYHSEYFSGFPLSHLMPIFSFLYVLILLIHHKFLQSCAIRCNPNYFLMNFIIFPRAQSDSSHFPYLTPI